MIVCPRAAPLGRGGDGDGSFVGTAPRPALWHGGGAAPRLADAHGDLPLGPLRWRNGVVGMLVTLALACDADSVCDSTYDGFRGAAGYSARVGEAANPGPASDDVGTDDEVEPPVWPTERLTRFLDECELGLHAHALSEADASANPEGGDWKQSRSPYARDPDRLRDRCSLLWT